MAGVPEDVACSDFLECVFDEVKSLQSLKKHCHLQGFARSLYLIRTLPELIRCHPSLLLE